MPWTGLDTVRREPYADGASFGAAGPYDRIDARLSFVVAPEHPANAGIVDLDLAPRDERGLVRFSADVIVLAPRDPARGNGAALVEAVNRGQPLSPRILNRTPYTSPAVVDVGPGDGFLFRHGYTVLHLGWQWDVRDEALLGFDAPEALEDGRPLEGRTVVEIRPSVRETTRLLANRNHRVYRAADVNERDAQMTVRDWEDGEVSVVPRDRWAFAMETPDGLQSSDEHVHLIDGFEPGRQYHVVYTTRGAPVVGAGLIAFRDTAGFLRSGDAANPVAGHIDRVHGFGMSQSGRLLRHYLYLGLNRDEEGNTAYDGLIPHVAGARRGEFNHRFAQPSVQLTPNFGHRFPFADGEQPDLHSGEVDGLLARQRAAGGLPKIIYLNSSAEYWRGDCSLMHTDPTGSRDLEHPDGVRHYLLASTQHFPGEVPQVDYNPHDGARGRYGFNTVEYTPLVRAALVNLDRWVADGVEPPPSRYPRRADGTAVDRAAVLEALGRTPGRYLPDPRRLPVLREVDLGPGATSGTGRYPVREGGVYPCWVSAVDDDGNEVAGVRLPDVTVPLGTHLAFNPRHPATGAPEQIMSMQGSTWFFARTRAERQARADPRRCIEERYADRSAFLSLVRARAEELVRERYVLAEDVDTILADAAARWDYAMRGAPVDDSPWLQAVGA